MSDNLQTAVVVRSHAKATHESLTLKRAQPWAIKITEAWNRSVRSIVEVGQHLSQADDALFPDEWNTLLSLLPFGKRTAERLRAIGRSELIGEHMDRLPPHWPTLYQLSRLDRKTFMMALEAGAIHPGMERREVPLQGISKSSTVKGKPFTQEYDAAPESAYDSGSIANSCIVHIQEQLQHLPPPIAQEVGTILLNWLHDHVEGGC